ncbi:MAG: WD40/YVTN/BNR-like repeat-containing protein [Phycisphaerae bacterium]
MRKIRLTGPCAVVLAFVLGCDQPARTVAQTPQDGGPTTHAATEPAAAVRHAGAGAEDAPRAPRVLRESDLKGLAWRSVGPANMGGRVADIAVAPGNPKIFFIGYATGGLFKTTNAGTTFSPVFDQESTSSIGAVAVADAPPDWPGWEDEDAKAAGDADKDAGDKGKARIVWVGTGEGNGRNSSSWGNGVYRSTDGGATFTNVGLRETQDIPRIAVDPRNPDVCYVAAMGHLWGPNQERGLYKTTDGGKTWEAALQVDELTGCCDVVLDPKNPDTVYAAMYTRLRQAHSFQSGGPKGGIFRSDDGGATWKKLTDGLPSETGRIGLDVFRADPRIVYASVESDTGGRIIDAWHNYSRAGGVFRSEDHGETWQRMSDLAPRSFYFSRIRVDPKDDQRVYLPGWGLGVSDDGGRHFRAGLARITHVDMHTMFIDPDDTDHLMIGNDGGVYVSHDRGVTWEFLNHMAVGQFYNIAVDGSDPYRIGGGLQDNGTWIGPSGTLRQGGGESREDPGWGITNADWRFVSGGDGFRVAFDPTDPNIVYAESQGGQLVRIHLDTGRRKRLIPAPKEGQPRFRFNWNTPFFISPHEPTTLYMAGNYVFKLTDRGDEWTRISEDLSSGQLEKMITVGSDAETYGTVVSLAESPIARGMLWAGTDDGLVHLTTDDGKTWTNVTPPEAGGRYIAGVEASRHSRDTAYVAIDGHRNDDMEPHLFATDDAGGSWRSIVGDLPAGAPVKVVREDVVNASVLYVGTEHAAYVSIDRGEHWVKLNGKTLPTAIVADLLQHPREMDLIAGTHGRSIYVLDDASPLSQLTPEVLEKDLHVFTIPPAKPRIYMPYGGLWSHRMFRAKNPPMGARISYWLRSYSGEDVSITITDAHDAKVRSLTGSNRPGINRVVWDLQPEPHDRFGNPEAFLGQTRFVPAGTYTATVSQGEKKVKQSFTVLPSPILDD